MHKDDFFNDENLRNFLIPIICTKNCTVLHFFWRLYLIKGAEKLFSKITLKFYVLGLGNQCVTP